MWSQQRPPPPNGQHYERTPTGGGGGGGGDSGGSWSDRGAGSGSLPPRPNMPPPGGRDSRGPPGPGWERGSGNGNGGGRPSAGGAWPNKRDADWHQPGGGGGDPPSAKRGRWDDRGTPSSSPRASGWDRGPDSASARTPGMPEGGAGEMGGGSSSSGWDRRPNGRANDDPRDSRGGGPAGRPSWDQPSRPPSSAAMADGDRSAASFSAASGSASGGGRGWDQVSAPPFPPCSSSYASAMMRLYTFRTARTRVCSHALYATAATVFLFLGRLHLAASWSADARWQRSSAASPAGGPAGCSTRATTIGSWRPPLLDTHGGSAPAWRVRRLERDSGRTLRGRKRRRIRERGGGAFHRLRAGRPPKPATRATRRHRRTTRWIARRSSPRSGRRQARSVADLVRALCLRGRRDQRPARRPPDR